MAKLSGIKAVCFDYGGTLAVSSLPLIWTAFYKDALTAVAEAIGIEPTESIIEAGERTLLKYNAKVHPREYEVGARQIFTEMFRAWNMPADGRIEEAEETFANFFQKSFELDRAASPTLHELKAGRIKIGVLTNVACGQDKKYMLPTIAPVIDCVDAFLGSADVGFRKPHPKGYLDLTAQLGVKPAECVFVGDEEVDVRGANGVGMISILLNVDANPPDYGQHFTVKTLAEVANLIYLLGQNDDV